jgi:LytS/YehU family sensor histidine kinase/ligand-binding sensor domain-containing protein
MAFVEILHSNYVIAQTMPLHKLMVRRLTTADGLLTNQVYSIHQDGKGYMWFGGKGLQRYDGYRVKTFVPFSFPQIISFIVDDADNNIYFGLGADLAYPKKIYKLNTKTDSFSLFQDSITIEGKRQKLLIAHTPIKAKDGTIWFALYPNAYGVLKPHAKQIEVVSDGWHLQESIHYRHTFEFWNDQYIWQSNPKDGIFRIDIKNYSITSAKKNPLQEKIFNYITEPMLNCSVDKDTNFWSVLLDGDGKYFYHVNHQTFAKKAFQFPTPNLQSYDYIHQIQHDKKGNIWITPSGHSGIAKYNALEDKLDFMHVTTSAENKLRHQYTFGAAGMNIFIDKDNNVWYPGDGVQFFNPTGQQIISYSNTNLFTDIKASITQKENINGGSAIDALQMANKDIYVSYCVAGLIKFDSNGNHPENINLNMPFDCLRKMFTPDGINLYIKNSYNKEFFVYNTITKQTKRLQNDYLNKSNITKTYRENDTTIWIADGEIGLSKYNPKKNTITKINKTGWKPEEEWYIRSIVPEGNNAFWISISFYGLVLIEKSTGNILEKFIPDPIHYSEKSDANTIVNIVRWNTDSLILTTFDGLLFYNTKTKVAKRLSIEDGLSDNYLSFCIADTASKNLWINSTYKGLFKYNMLTKKVAKLAESEGNFLSLGTRIGLQLGNHDMLFFFTNGMAYVKKDKKFNNYKPHNVIISEVAINGVSKNIDEYINTNKKLQLNKNENDIVINFSCLDYWSNLSLKYYTYLEGLDTGYTYTEHQTQLVYKGIASGTYTLHIKAAYQNGNFSKEETTFIFSVLPPFYKTWWFTLCSLLLASYGLFYFLKKQNETALHLANLKNEQLQNKLEIEEINNFFNASLLKTNTVEEVLKNVAKNLIRNLNLDDCMIFLYDKNDEKLIQVAGYGIDNFLPNYKPFEVKVGEGIVGNCAYTKEAIIVPDTTIDERYINYGAVKGSEICVPILHENELYGIIDCEHSKKSFYTQHHLNILSTIAAIIANKINAINSTQQLQLKEREMESINQQLAEAQLSALRSQMNPHFIFNCLNSINSVVVEGNIPLASDYLTKFSILIRLILENSKSNSIKLSKELEAVKLYVLMEKIRFENKFDYEVNIDESIDTDNIYLPPTTIQPFVENAIMHGLMHKSTKGVLKINVNSNGEDQVQIVISDNGIGRTAASRIKSTTNTNKSYGLQITNERILQINKKNTIEIFDLVDGNFASLGTRVLIKLVMQE